MTASIKALSDGLSGELQVNGNPSFRFGADTSGQLAGFRNKIINGAMQVWQRGTSFPSSGGTYAADRFLIQSASAFITAQRAAGYSGFQYAMQLVGGTGNTGAAAVQRIEAANCADLVGKSITISAYMFGTAQPTLWQVFSANSADTWTAPTLIAQGSWNVTGAAQRFTATIDNLPVGAANGLALHIVPANGGAFTSGSLTMTGVQLEEGSIATPFEQRPIGLELSLCQRYFISGVRIKQSGYAPNANIFGGSAWFPPMRVTPSISNYSQANSGLTSGGVTANGNNSIFFEALASPGGAVTADMACDASAEL